MVAGPSYLTDTLYYENFGPEHYGEGYVFSFESFFSFFKDLFYYTFFMPFIILVRRDKLAASLALGIVPYSLMLGTVENIQFHYMFPVVCIWLVAGLRAIFFRGEK